MNEQLFFPQPPHPSNKGGIPITVKIEKINSTTEILAKQNKEGILVVVSKSHKEGLQAVGMGLGLGLTAVALSILLG